MSIFHGPLSYAIGRRPVILASVAVYVVASIGAELAPGLGVLLAFRVLQGLSAGGAAIVSRTVIREAISTLAGRGLLENRPRFRPVVRKPDYTTVLRAAGDIVRHLVADRDGIANLYRSRVFLERALVRGAREPPRARAALAAALDRRV